MAEGIMKKYYGRRIFVQSAGVKHDIDIDGFSIAVAAEIGVDLSHHRVRSFDEMRFHHYRLLGTAEMNRFQAISDYGKRAYFLGGSPVWQLVRCAYRIPQKPYVLGAVALGWGYFWASLRRVKRPVSREMIRFHRKDQMNRLRAILKAKLTGKKIDAFRTGN